MSDIGLAFHIDIVVEGTLRRLHMQYSEPFDFIDMNSGAPFEQPFLVPSPGHYFLVVNAEHRLLGDPPDDKGILTTLTIREVPDPLSQGNS